MREQEGHSIAQTNSGRDVNAHVLTYTNLFYILRKMREQEGSPHLSSPT
jgi:hypothetical protein